MDIAKNIMRWLMPKKYCESGASSRTNNVCDVSRYIINYSNKKGYGISNLKLQKILYFVQAYFLITEPYTACFNEKIEAWDFGPVVPVAYHEFKQYGSGNIPYIETYIKRDVNDIWGYTKVRFDENIISKKDKEKIRDVIDSFSQYSATDLVSLTHRQSPWKDAYRTGAHSEITKEAIRTYFNNKEVDYVYGIRYSELVHRIQ